MYFLKILIFQCCSLLNQIEPQGTFHIEIILIWIYFTQWAQPSCLLWIYEILPPTFTLELQQDKASQLCDRVLSYLNVFFKLFSCFTRTWYDDNIVLKVLSQFVLPPLFFLHVQHYNPDRLHMLWPMRYLAFKGKQTSPGKCSRSGSQTQTILTSKIQHMILGTI